jgi:Velvet factor
MHRLQNFHLVLRQGPERALVVGKDEKNRRPVDPPPVIQLVLSDGSDPERNYLQSPYLFVCAALCDAREDKVVSSIPGMTAPGKKGVQTTLAGTPVSSLHRLRDSTEMDEGFFVFGDLSVKVEGNYRLRFTLYEMRKYVHTVLTIASHLTNAADQLMARLVEKSYKSLRSCRMSSLVRLINLYS